MISRSGIDWGKCVTRCRPRYHPSRIVWSRVVEWIGWSVLIGGVVTVVVAYVTVVIAILGR